MQDSTQQREVFAFLSDPATYGLAEPIRTIATHGAAVFLAGHDVYKVKRAVRYPYMDFSTLEKRKAACERELAINRETAPGLYLGVVPIAREGSKLHIGGKGDAVEWAVHLRRFDEEATLDRIVERGERIGSQLISLLAREVAAMHRRAPVRDGAAATFALRFALDETLDELQQASRFVSPALLNSLAERMISLFAELRPLMISRGEQGAVRRCHGDLHLGNIALIDEKPVIFDALEFDEALAITDTLYDLAFLVMDLCQRGLRGEANRLLNNYLWLCDAEKREIEGMKLFPLYLALRALIRAKVKITQAKNSHSPHLQSDVDSYINSACAFLEVVPKRLVAVGGLSGSGKTTLSAAIASFIGAAPGAIHLRSDIERKRLFGVKITEPLDAECYTESASAKVYDRLNDYGGVALNAGFSVILDATFREKAERDAATALSLSRHVPFSGIWLEATPELLLARVSARQADASDATPQVVTKQLEEPRGSIDWARLDASGPLYKLKDAALRLIG